MPNPSDISAQSVRENFAPLSKENGEGPNTNTEFDSNNIVNTIISLLCGLCSNTNNNDEMLGLDQRNNATQRLVDPNATDDLNNTGELLLRSLEKQKQKTVSF